MVRMQFIAIRAIATSQRGDSVCAPAAASGNARTTEKKVAITAICTVSAKAPRIWPDTEKSGGKKRFRNRIKFAV